MRALGGVVGKRGLQLLMLMLHSLVSGVGAVQELGERAIGSVSGIAIVGRAVGEREHRALAGLRGADLRGVICWQAGGAAGRAKEQSSKGSPWLPSSCQSTASSAHFGVGFTTKRLAPNLAKTLNSFEKCCSCGTNSSS